MMLDGSLIILSGMKSMCCNIANLLTSPGGRAVVYYSVTNLSKQKKTKKKQFDEKHSKKSRKIFVWHSLITRQESAPLLHPLINIGKKKKCVRLWQKGV